MTAALRVLYVGPLPPPSGGMANQTRQLMQLMQRDGIDARIVRTNEPYRPAWMESVRGLRALFRLVPYLVRLWRESGRADVAHVMANSGWAWYLFASPAIAVAKWRGRRVIVNYRGGLAREFLARSARRVTQTLRGTRLVVPSAFLESVFAGYGIRAEVIPNIVDIERFRPASPSAGPRRQREPHLVVARNLEHIYGIDTALRAVAVLRRDHPSLHVSIAGSGPDRAALEALAVELGIAEAVRFTGRLEVAEMVALYQSADVVLNPSRADNTPNSVLEALACGVPVVSTNVGGVPFLVEHDRTAWLVPPEDAAAVAEGVARLLRDDVVRERLVINGLALAQSCSWPAVKDRWLRAYAPDAR